MVALTGATGLLGMHMLYALLKERDKVVAFYRDAQKIKHATAIFSLYGEDFATFEHRVEWRQVDLLDLPSIDEGLAGVDSVVHCAAQVSFHPKEGDRIIAYNRDTTANLVNCCLAAEVKDFIHISSVAALGRNKDQQQLIDEKTSWQESKYNSRYARSKYEAEIQVWRGQEEGLRIAVICPPIILAPGLWDQSSGRLFSTVAKGVPFYTTGMNAFVDVRNLTDLTTRILQSDIRGEKFITAGFNASYADLFFKIAEITEAKRPFIRLRSLLSGILWRIEWLRSKITGSKPLITKETAQSAQGIYRYSSEKVKKKFDFTFYTMEETVDWLAFCWKQ